MLVDPIDFFSLIMQIDENRDVIIYLFQFQPILFMFALKFLLLRDIDADADRTAIRDLNISPPLYPFIALFSDGLKFLKCSVCLLDRIPGLLAYGIIGVYKLHDPWFFEILFCKPGNILISFIDPYCFTVR